MATFKSKGTTLYLTVSSALVPIAQMISQDFGEVADETYEADYLDNANAGIPYAPSGRIEPGKISGEIFLDLTSGGATNHASYLNTLLASPSSSGTAGTLQLGGSSSTSRCGLVSFTAAGFGAQITTALKDGIKAKINIKLSGAVTFSS